MTGRVKPPWKEQIIFSLRNGLSDYLVKKKLSLGKTFVGKRKTIFRERYFKEMESTSCWRNCSLRRKRLFVMQELCKS